MIVTARVINEDGGTFGVQLNHDGPIVLTEETWQVCSNVADALVHPERWAMTECGEVADAIRKAHGHAN